jgi:AGCS family alanine or glycine:cation symporter
MSLAGRVGTGNIAGVATAIAFWWTWSHVLMWMVASLGASTSHIEGLWHKFIKKAFRTALVEAQHLYIESDQE